MQQEAVVRDDGAGRPLQTQSGTRPTIEGLRSSGEFSRTILCGGISVFTQMTVLAAFIWGAYTLAGLVFDNFSLQLILAAAIAFIGSLFVLPLVSILMMPVTLILAWPLDLVFPPKNEAQASKIQWCRTCKHHRKVSDYEDTTKGLWCDTSMPRIDKLPCRIVLETSQAWKAYYETAPRSRSLFPKNCPHYERHSHRPTPVCMPTATSM